MRRNGTTLIFALLTSLPIDSIYFLCLYACCGGGIPFSVTDRERTLEGPYNLDTFSSNELLDHAFSCAPVALNTYFQRAMFTSFEDYLNEQNLINKLVSYLGKLSANCSILI